MNHTPNRRTFLESAFAYTRARQPTPQLTANLCADFAQMMADDFDGPVQLMLPIGLRVVREPVRARRA
ncbi:hypothetical protein CI15_33435 [Paraburkholderia monticola]|uniref:Uncharacterized protein n=1 Tax=Paraburkholderia monticola TaxID=1399968 RepID=A0A149PBN2_9BURK|nr:hypothetical protein [Paraburkholderia monticola]KXU82439.1 hypothetical protein CI15_33435 [Paraburkholderia monticola]